MDIVYKPGKENVVADWLSRALIVNAIEEDRGESSRGPQQFMNEWTPEEEGEHDEVELSNGKESLDEGSPIEERPTEMEELENIINDKRRQMIWKTKTSGLMKVQSSKYGKCPIITIWSELGVNMEQISKALKDASEAGTINQLCIQLLKHHFQTRFIIVSTR